LVELFKNEPVNM